MKLPSRSSSHSIETTALNIIRNKLGGEFLIRQQDDRDYGIDIQVERFDGETPTGDIFLAQIKGTERPFSEPVSIANFPVMTLNYACLFSAPFFLFYTSTSTKQTKFIWLQKYVEFHLKPNHSKFKNQETITIKFPENNNLEANIDKILEIVKEEKLIKVAHAFIMPYRRLLHAHEQLKKSNTSFVHAAIHAVTKISASGALDARVEISKHPMFEFDVAATLEHLHLIKKSMVLSETDQRRLAELLLPLKFIELGFLNNDLNELSNIFLLNDPPY